MDLDRSRGGPELNQEQQQQRDLERQREKEQHETQQMPSVQAQIDKALNKHPDTQQALRQLPEKEQEELKKAIAERVIQYGGRNPRVDHIGISPKDGSLYVLSNKHISANYDLGTQQILQKGEKPTQPITPVKTEPAHPKTPGQPPQQTDTTHNEQPRRDPSEKEPQQQPPQIDPQDPERLKTISQQINDKLDDQLKNYTPEQQEQLKHALTKELSELGGQHPSIDSLNPLANGELQLSYNRGSKLTIDPNEVLQLNQPQPEQTQTLPEDLKAQALRQTIDHTEAQLAPHLTEEQLNSSQQATLANRIGEKIHQIGGDNAQIKQITATDDGRLQIELNGQREQLLVHPQALLAENGLSDQPEHNLPGIQTYRPGLDGPIDYTVQKGDSLARIGENLCPEHPKAFAYYAYENLSQTYGTDPKSGGIHFDKQSGHMTIHPGQQLSVDLSDKTPEQLQHADRTFAQQETLEHNLEQERIRAAQQLANETAAAQRNQEIADQARKERQDNPYSVAAKENEQRSSIDGRSSAKNTFYQQSAWAAAQANNLSGRPELQRSNPASSSTQTSNQSNTSSKEANWQYSKGVAKGSLETGKDIAVGAITFGADTLYGAGNILSGGIFNNTNLMQGVVQRNNAFYEGLYNAAGNITGKSMYYAAHPGEAIDDAARVINNYRQERQTLFAQGRYEEAGKRDGSVGTEIASFAIPAGLALKPVRMGKVMATGRAITAEENVLQKAVRAGKGADEVQQTTGRMDNIAEAGARESGTGPTLDLKRSTQKK